MTLQPFGALSPGATVSVVGAGRAAGLPHPDHHRGLLSAIGIAGMDRLVQRNVLAMSGRAVEAAGDVQTLLLDKTGTITLGNRMASRLHPGRRPQRAGPGRRGPAGLAGRRDAGGPLDRGAGQGALRHPRARAGRRARRSCPSPPRPGCRASTWTAVRSARARPTRSSAGSTEQGGTVPPSSTGSSSRSPAPGPPRWPWPTDPTILGVIELKDVVKQGIRERFDEMRAMGIRTVMITGDNPLTAAAIAQEAGVDDFLAEATPEAKMDLIKAEQEGGKLVAMTGDGTNDAPALAQADVGVAMNTGTTAAKEAGNMVDLDSNPTKLIDIVEIGKQLLITRGALTTFSHRQRRGQVLRHHPGDVRRRPTRSSNALNIMRLHSPQSAVLSAVIFNALVIVALIPLALRGVRVPADRRRGDPAPQRVHLRGRRDHRPVHRHQAHRPDPHGAAAYAY